MPPHPEHTATWPAWRRLPIGVELAPPAPPSTPSAPSHDGRAHARLWAPAHDRVELVTYDADDRELGFVELARCANGYHEGWLTEANAGTLYRFRFGGGKARPDPASRFQPKGPHGPSQIVDPSAYRWRDGAWKGVALEGQIVYELHIGTFTPDGTFRAAMERLPGLAELGITVLEVMPVADFPGRFGWGYDGVDLFAPAHLYGSPDDVRAFVDRAHELGLGIILDVVYNHLGPDGNYLEEFSPHYFDGATEWGQALNFDGESCGPVRELFVANAGYWIDEFHFDGLRLDATQQIYDDSTPHILAEVATRVREAARGRATIVVGENEPQEVRLLRPRAENGCGLDALWNDDFHHAARVACTGADEAYYSGYRGRAQELVSAAKWGYLYQGQWYRWQDHRRGTPTLDIEPPRLVSFVQNHDQVANSAKGLRLHQLTSPGRYRAITALLLLMPQTPMLFMGQEFAASSPFLYFADHHPELAKQVRRGRVEFLAQFPSVDTPASRERVPDPADPATFARCKLDWSDRDAHADALLLVRDLLRLRKADATFAAQGRGARLGVHGLDGAVLDRDAFVLRFFGAANDGRDDRLLAVNLGRRLQLDPLPEPLLAPPAGALWRTRLSTEEPRYGGAGAAAVDTDDGGWWLAAECSTVLVPVPRASAPPAPRPRYSQDEKR